MNKQKQIRIAIIGCGMISERHMTVINNLIVQGQNLKVVAAAEIKPDRLEAFGQKWGLLKESVYGVQSCDYWTDPTIDKEVNRPAPIEDLGVGLARFKGGLSMDIYEDWAMHMDDIGTSFIAGSEGGLKFIDVDTTGGPLTVRNDGQITGGGILQKPRLEWFGVDKEGRLFDTKLDCAIGDITGQQELMLHPEMEMYNDNQLQWYSYLRGDLTDETRIDSPYIAMQTAFLSEGVVLSNELGRSVTADEIREKSRSIAIREQETPFGTIKYDFDEYKPE